MPKVDGLLLGYSTWGLSPNCGNTGPLDYVPGSDTGPCMHCGSRAMFRMDMEFRKRIASWPLPKSLYKMHVFLGLPEILTGTYMAKEEI